MKEVGPREAVSSLIEAGDLAALKKLVKLLLERSVSGKSNLIFCDLFIENMLSAQDYSSSFEIVEIKKDLCDFVLRYLNGSIRIKYVSKEIRIYQQLLKILNGFFKSDYYLLEEAVVLELIKLLYDFGISKLVEHSQDKFAFKLYLIPYSHREYNSFTHPEFNLIAIFKAKQEQGKQSRTPETEFLHGVGLLLCESLTEGEEAFPSSFEEIYASKFAPASKIRKKTIFADCFSLAVMYNTPYISKNPFAERWDELFQKRLNNYFRSLC
ncbi:hypothetical protein [Fuchsiella alkaliacetigena]|uniref:hypothetical protein n=1 Tax=Fuchsiella alkaliacetigena TaxID=957042 RepID=UPI00200B0364|nr:hypothetical protein [Fuchsiella alkaliacetigena]MCK8823824.1 hypothetical protein [Fuchsiella alkaliacetigena]